MMEIFFSIITRQATRGMLPSVKDLIAAIEKFIDGWNDRCRLHLDQDRRRVTPTLQAR
jgi:hypothetical protein